MYKLVAGFALLISLFTLLAAPVVTAASAQDADAQRLHKSIKASTITGYLDEARIANELTQLDDGSFVITTPTNKGNVYLIILDPCGAPSGTGCSNMSMIAISPTVGLPYPTMDQNLLAMNIINLNLMLGKGFIVDGLPMFARFDHFYFGVVKGNLMNDLAAAAAAGDFFIDVLTQLKSNASPAVSLSAQEDQLANLVLQRDRNSQDLESLQGIISDRLPQMSVAVREFIRTGQALDSPVLFALQPGGKQATINDFLKD